MNKQQAKIELERLKEQIKNLEEIIDHQDLEKFSSILDYPEPRSGQVYYRIGLSFLNELNPVKHYATNEKEYSDGNIFTDIVAADNHAKAIETLLLLRHQPGTEIAIDDKRQWVIEADTGGRGAYVDDWDSIEPKLNGLSPVFSSYEHAENAIENVGVNNIAHMFKTFHGIYE